MSEDDVLLRALRELPRPSFEGGDGRDGSEGSGAGDPREADRARRAARAAFVRAHEGEPWHARVPGLGRVAVPAVLACVVFVYLGWAISAVNALAR